MHTVLFATHSCRRYPFTWIEIGYVPAARVANCCGTVKLIWNSPRNQAGEIRKHSGHSNRADHHRHAADGCGS